MTMQTGKSKQDTRSILIGYLKNNGYRSTPERLAVIDGIATLKGMFTIDMLYSRICDLSFAVSTATVYNTIKLFVDGGVVRQLNICDNATMSYEVVHGRWGAYLICNRCGKTRRLAAQDLFRQIEQFDYGTFTPEGYDLKVNGLCRNCARKQKQ